jgi:hypothetical protein
MAIAPRLCGSEWGDEMGDLSIRLRPVSEDGLALFRFVSEPGLIGLDWAGFRDAQGPA